MKITLNDCLKMNSLIGAKILAAGSRFNRDVNSVSVIEASSVEEAELNKPEKGQLLLTGFFAVRDDVAVQCGIVKAVAEKGCAGLVVFYVGKVVEKISPEVIAAAEEADLPLIEIPGEHCKGFYPVIAEITEKVLYRNEWDSSLVNDSIYDLMNFEKHSNFQSAAEHAAMNNDFQLVILTSDYNPVLTVETTPDIAIDEAVRQARERRINKRAGIYVRIDADGVATYWGRVNISGGKYLMFIVDNNNSYSAVEITKLADVIEMAMNMWKYTPKSDVRSELIKALIRGNKSLAYSLKDEAGIENDEIISVFMGIGIEKGRPLKIMSDFENEKDLRIIKRFESDSTYGIIIDENVNDKGAYADRMADCNVFFERMEREQNVCIFHVTEVNGIEGAGDACRLIAENCAFAQDVFPYSKIFTKFELVLVSNCINIQLQGGHVKRNYMKLLEPFAAKNGSKGKQLLRTLEIFVLDTGMNIGKTAKLIGVHANTIQYRLKKINELLGVELNGKKAIPGLVTALTLKRLERAVS